MNVPRLHHYVPQFYLRRFSDRDGYLWVWDKEKDRVFKTTPKSIAAESDFYKLHEVADKGADPMMMEKHFAELEADVAAITGQWLDWIPTRQPNRKIPIPKGNRWLVSMYIALQFFRTADTKDIITRLEGLGGGQELPDDDRYGIYATYLSSLRFSEREPAESDQDEDSKVDEQLLEAQPKASEETRRRRHTHFLYDPNFVTLLADRIDKSIWIFGRNRSGCPFVTSDNPVAFKTGDNRMWIKAGLLVPGTYVVFPLSPEVVLYCHDRVPPFDKLVRYDRSVSPVEFDASLVEQDNTGQVFMAGRFVISSVNDFVFLRGFAETIGTDKYAPPELVGKYNFRKHKRKSKE